MRSDGDGSAVRKQSDEEAAAGAAFFEANSELMTLFFRHISVCPPRGPFKYYSALTFTERARRWLAAHAPNAGPAAANALTPAAVLQLMEKYYNTQHLRNWPLLYVPAEVRLKDVDALIAERK